MTRLHHLKPLLLRNPRQIYCSHRFMSKTSKNDDDNSNSASQEPNKKEITRPMYIPEGTLNPEDIEEPTNCCMSGCPNCVWIEYAEKLSMVLKGSPNEVQKMIMEKVQDPNMRAFLSMELRIRKLIE